MTHNDIITAAIICITVILTISIICGSVVYYNLRARGK